MKKFLFSLVLVLIMAMNVNAFAAVNVETKI